jgi:hypothetical protein
MVLTEIFLGFLVSLVCSIHPVFIPVTVDDIGGVFVHGRVERYHGQYLFKFRLDAYITVCRIPPSTEYGRAIGVGCSPQDIILLSANGEHEFTRFHDASFFQSHFRHNASPRELSIEASLAIGPRSSLVAEHDSVELIHNLRNQSSAILVLGNSEENFKGDFCVPGTVVSTVLDSHPDFVLATFNDDAHTRQVGFRREGSLFEFPSSLFSPFETIIRENGARIIQEEGRRKNMVFESCNRVRELMQPINITFTQSNGTAVGHLSVLPIDFLRVVEDDVCELLIRSSREGPESVYMDFLMLKGLNVRYSRDRITVCDTSL